MPSANSVSKSPLPCPRCDSINTKFCYFNNYNFSQPRHFCKSCRRYWTHGGALRDIPVGGGTRKTSKRCRSSSASTVVSSARAQPATEPFHGNPLINSTNSFVSMLSGFGFGPELGAWAFPDGGGYVSGAINGGGVPNYRGVNGGDTWHLENGVAADFFPPFPQLGISHTGNGLK